MQSRAVAPWIAALVFCLLSAGSVPAQWMITPTTTPLAPCQLIGPVVQRACIDVACLSPVCPPPVSGVPLCVPYKFLLAAPATNVDPCVPQSLNNVVPIVACEVPCDWPYMGPLPLCDVLPAFVKNHLAHCINASAPGRVCAYVDSTGALIIESVVPFQVLIGGREVDPLGVKALPVAPNCAVNNLCDNVSGNEREPHRAGVAVRMCAPPPPPTNTPTRPTEPTKTPTPPVEPTNTPTQPCVVHGEVVQREIIELGCVDPMCGNLSPNYSCGGFTVVLAPLNLSSPDRCAPQGFNQWYARCDLPCIVVPPPGTDPNVPLCEAIARFLRKQLVECLNAQSGGRFCAELGPLDHIAIRSALPFQVLVIGHDPGMPPERILPLWPECPVNNLCDGIQGNERSEHVSGIYLRMLGTPPPPTHTPTDTPPSPPPPTRTFTPTNTPTPERPCELIGPAVQALLLDICCKEPVGCTDATRCFPAQLVINPLTVNDLRCDPVTVLSPLAMCEMPCNSVLAPGVVIPCSQIVPLLKQRLVACINASGQGRVCAKLLSDGLIAIYAVVPFDVVVMSDELGLPPSFAPAGLPVRPQCPVNNLCNGIIGDEREPHRNGICVTVKGPLPTWTPRPTWTPWPTWTLPPTWTPRPTLTPWPTKTPVPTWTPIPTRPCELVGRIVQREHLDIRCLEPLCLTTEPHPCPPFTIILAHATNSPSADRCAPVRLDNRPLALCEVPCTWPVDVSPDVPCDRIPMLIKWRLVQCINAMAGGRVCATLMRDGTVRLEGAVKFQVLVSGPELALPWDAGLPVWPECPVNNLCNGVRGDERRGHWAGLSVLLLPQPEPTATPTASGEVTDTPTAPEPTDTPTAPPDCALVAPPRVSALLQVDCIDPWSGDDPFTLHIMPRFVVPHVAWPPNPCRPVRVLRDLGRCELETPLVDCLCPCWGQDLAERIVKCLNNTRLALHGYLCAYLADNTGQTIRIDSIIPFQLAVTSAELGYPPHRGLLILEDCPVSNLWDDVEGNERQPFVAGAQLSIRYMRPPQPTPIPRPTWRPLPLPGDLDGDGIPDLVEAPNPPGAGRTNQVLADSDGDGLLDGAEGANLYDDILLDPRLADTDGDRVPDGIGDLLGACGVEQLLSAEDLADADHDGLIALLDPDDTNPDVDGDGVRDGYEAVHGGPDTLIDPQSRSGIGDVNGDTLVTNLDALMVQTFFLNLINANQGLFSNGDLDCDGALTNLDALVGHAFFLGLVGLLPL